MNKKIITDKNSSVRNFKYRFLPYWPLFFILCIISIFGAWVCLKLATPIYEVNAKILISNDKKEYEDIKAVDSLDLIYPKRRIDNEIEIIQSKTLLNSVVKDLNLNAPVFEKKKFIIISAYISSPIKILTDSLTLKETKQVFFKVKNDNVIIDNIAYPLNKWVNTPYGSLEFKKNNYAVEPQNDKQFYFSLIPPNKMIAGLASSLKITTADKMPGIVNINLTDEIPIRGENIINDLIKVYSQYIIDKKNIVITNTSALITAHLQKVESDLLGIEQKLQIYKSRRGTANIDAYEKLHVQNESDNNQDVNKINAKLLVLNNVENYVNSKDLAKETVPSTVGIEDPSLIQMVKNIYQLQIESDGLKTTIGEKNALYLSYTDRINKIKTQILENLRNQKTSLLANRQNVSVNNNNHVSFLRSVPSTQIQLADIYRERNFESGLYAFLLQKKEEIELSYLSNVFASKIIDPAEAADTPIGQKKKFIYLGSLFLALIVSIGTVAGREFLRTKVMFKRDIEELTILPLIGAITVEQSKNPIIISDNQRTLIARQFRKLRTALKHLGVGTGQKRIMITSTIPGEGKSFIAVNLAISMALTGKKIVLIDYNLNNPSLANKLNIESGHLGITEYLQGSENAESIVLQTEINENLFFIPTGKLPNNPSELITNGKSEELLKELDTMFDYIIIDIAAVRPVSDAYLLSPFCHATLYVIRYGYTPKIVVERIDENNKLTNAAIVFNSVSKKAMYNNYGNSNGYNYNDN